MIMNTEQISRYLTRIGIAELPEVSPFGLEDLHRNHMMNVPFEDLDIHTGVPLALSLNHLYNKIVLNHRGGFCYELNYLFGKLLEKLGFEVDYLAAQVYGEDNTYGSYYDHLTLRVNHSWLCDVGFGGGSFICPLHLHHQSIQQDPGGRYRVDINSRICRVTRNQGESDNWTPLYQFDQTPRSIEEFKAECEKKQTEPDSHFVKHKICTMATTDGRKTLRNDEFSIRSGPDKETLKIKNAAHEAEILENHFGVVLKTSNTG